MVQEDMMTKNVALWTIQLLMAALFLFAGVMKLVLPIEAMTGALPLPGAFLRFIGVAETLGGLGLILPGVLRVHQELTSLAALGLALIMSGATVVTILSGGTWSALFPLAVGVLSVAVARGRAPEARPRFESPARSLSAPAR
jgi:uncharacterized membrane protein YphA (DoxX/SURF4 family)